MNTYFGKEAIDLAEEFPQEFENIFKNAKSMISTRIKVFEKHGKGNSSSAKKLKNALNEARNATSTKEKALALSQISLVANSARGSYSRSRAIDKKIADSLNKNFSKKDKNGKIIKNFISLDELDDFGDAMEELKNDSLSDIYGSDQIVQTLKQALSESEKTGENYRSIFNRLLGIKGE